MAPVECALPLRKNMGRITWPTLLLCLLIVCCTGKTLGIKLPLPSPLLKLRGLATTMSTAATSYQKDLVVWNLTQNTPESGDDLQKPVVTIFAVYSNHTVVQHNGSLTRAGFTVVELPDTVATLILQCEASFPVEWVFTDHFPGTSDNLRSWHINASRTIFPSSSSSSPSLWDVSSFRFQSNLTFGYRAPAEPRQQLCRYAGLDPDRQRSLHPTKVSATIHGRFLRLSISTIMRPSNGSQDLQLQLPTPRYGNDVNCTYTLDVYDSTHEGRMICCGTSTENSQFFYRGCSNPSNCRGLFKQTQCLRRMNDTDSTPTPFPYSCIPFVELAMYGSSGIIVCGDEKHDSQTVAVNYFTSVLDLCSSNSTSASIRSNTTSTRRPPTLHIVIGEEEAHSRVANLQDEMLEMCPPRNTKMYVGETVEFKCVGAYYYFAGGFQYVLRRNRSGVVTEEVLAGGQELSVRTRYPPEREVIIIAQEFTLDVNLTDTSIFELTCAAPVWNSYAWVNKSLYLTVIEPTTIKILGEPEEVITVGIGNQNPHEPITCSASGDPTPLLTWHNLSSRTSFMRAVSDSELNSIQVQIDAQAWANEPESSASYTIRCAAVQERIGPETTVVKAFHLKREIPPGFSIVHVASATVVLVVLLFATFCVIVWHLLRKLKDKWRNLNPDEVKEFFNGRTVQAEGSRSGTPTTPTTEPQAATAANYISFEALEAEANAWNCRYNPRFELSLKGDLRIGREIARGEFSKVYLGTLRKTGATVGVKKNLAFRSMIEFKASLYELKLLIMLGEHENIVKLVGAVTANVKQRQIYVVLEYCEHGALKDYLTLNKDQLLSKRRTQVTNQDREGAKLGNIIDMGLLDWILQILNGLRFLRRAKVVHGDIALRNVLLHKDLTAKICDFGLSLQVTRTFYSYSVPPHAKRPCKSSAPESLARGEYSFKSDVYSFGILLWEMFSLGGAEPWAAVPCQSMRQVLETRAVLPEPVVSVVDASASTGRCDRAHQINLVPSCIYEKMKECWIFEPELRPTVQELQAFFRSLNTQDTTSVSHG